MVTFARWEEGLVIAPGNPKGMRKIEDLTRKNVRFVNREPGSGSRGLLDKLLENGRHGRATRFRDTIASRSVIWRPPIAWCPTMPMCASRLVLPHKPSAWISFRLHSERYDLVMRKRTADLPAVKAFLDVLQRATLRRKLEVLAGYDTFADGDGRCLARLALALTISAASAARTSIGTCQAGFPRPPSRSPIR